MKTAPITERLRAFRWCATQPIIGTPRPGVDGTVVAPVFAKCSIARTKRGALRRLASFSAEHMEAA